MDVTSVCYAMLKSLTAGCEEAYRVARTSGSTGDGLNASDICEKETIESCRGQLEGGGGGDDRYVMAHCLLRAKEGGFKRASKK